MVTTTSISSGASISSPGIGSGLDVNSIVSQMMAIEQQPLQLMQTKGSTIDTEISSYGQIKSAMSGLYDAANGVMDLGTWSNKLFTTGDSTTVTGSATSSATAANFSIQVNALAQGQSLASASLTSGTTMGAAGQLTLQTGSWDASGTTFTAGSGSGTTISIAATDTLADVAGKINGAGAGVNAVVVSGASGDRLLLTGANTGVANGFSVSVQGGGAPLQGLAYDQASVAGGGSGMTRTVAAQNAAFTIDGVSVDSASNTVQNVVPGVTLNLLKVNTSPVNVAINPDTQSVQTKVQAFVDAFNKLSTVITNLTSYDAATKVGQPLQGDSTAVGLQNALRSMLGQAGPGGTFFSDLGIQMTLGANNQGITLSVDQTKLGQALTNLPQLQQTLTASSGGTGVSGLITRVRDFAFAANGVDGNITTRTNGLNSLKQRNQDDMDSLQTLLDQRQATMLKQYQALDAQMGTLSSLSSFLTSQISQWNKG